uniref:Uncharacterized protein n=1 Tax=Meloidogyne enterolobii TaxID=390850 RepID=A0A6V7VIA9_MELEN|nr:unnamed protein product [Meloidogyne enterolobii]
MCYINVDILKAKSEETAFEKFTKQGCGNCPDNSITCRTCNSKDCNSQQFFKERHFCWISENSTEQCSVSEHKRICYYAVLNDKIVEQGCGNKTWNESNVRAAKCQNEHLCNTKKLLDESLFCLNKGKDELNETKSSVIQCDNECFTRRYMDGKLEQGCGNCTDVDCKSCKINFCNTKEIGVKHCWTNNGSTCSTGYYENCFTERTETNELNKGCGNCTSPTCKTCTGHRCNDGKNFPYYCLNSDGTSLLECSNPECYIDKDLNAGCGTCDGNKINISCVDCSGFKCNSRNKLEENVFCYEREENGKEREGSRPCVEKTCFISGDLLNGN